MKSLRIVSGLILFLCSALLATLEAQQQESNTRERAMIKMIDGSLYIGNLVEENSANLRLALPTGDTITVSKSDTRSIKGDDKFLLHKEGKYHYKTGYFYHAGMGFWGDAAEETGTTQMQFLYGVRLNELYSVAAGMGFEFHSTRLAGFPIDTQFASLFLYGRRYLTHKKKRLFVDGRLGVGLAGQDQEFASDHGSGFQFQFGSGIHFASRKQHRFVLTMGWHFQKTAGSESFLDDFGNEINADFDIWISRPVLRFAYEFH